MIITSSRGSIFILVAYFHSVQATFSGFLRSIVYLINKKDIKRKGKEKRTLGRPQRPQRVIAVPLRHFVKFLLLCDNCNIFSLRISKVLYNLPYRYLFFFFFTSRTTRKEWWTRISFFVYELTSPFPPLPIGLPISRQGPGRFERIIPRRYVKTRFPWWPTSPCRSSLPFRRTSRALS